MPNRRMEINIRNGKKYLQMSIDQNLYFRFMLAKYTYSTVYTSTGQSILRTVP